MALTELELEGKTVNSIYNDLIKGGLTSSDASILVGSWIFENFGRSKRVFDYQQKFPAADPDCVAKFARSFTHQDWVDGESVVQAQQTPGEEGFNVRFHQIETDLDAIRADVLKAFSCLATMRANLRSLLDEIRTEVNRINNDVFQCCNKDKVSNPNINTTFANLVENANFVGVTQFADKSVSVWKTDKGIMVLPAVSTVTVDVATDTRIRRSALTARLFEEDAAIRQGLGGQPFTKATLVSRFGAERSAGGLTLAELVQIIPDPITYPTLEALVDDLADREASALRTTHGADAAIAAAFGLETPVEKVATAPVEKLLSIPPAVRSVLTRRGIDTVGKLAAAAPRDIAALLKAEGITAAGAGDIAEWTTTAKALSKTR
jgi:hypothetical protein